MGIPMYVFNPPTPIDHINSDLSIISCVYAEFDLNHIVKTIRRAETRGIIMDLGQMSNSTKCLNAKRAWRVKGGIQCIHQTAIRINILLEK